MPLAGPAKKLPPPPLLSVDVFFIDWEKPRRVLAKGGGREEAAPVSCWRTLLVANEWNELQGARVTRPALTLTAVTALLDGTRLAAAAYMAPDVSAHDGAEGAAGACRAAAAAPNAC
jgi:hypothetical protein